MRTGEDHRRRSTRWSGARTALVLLVVGGTMAIWFYPLFLVISTALKTQSEAVTSPLALPSEPSLDAFWSAWTTLDMGTQLRNTLIIAVGTVVIATALSIVPAYAFSRFSFPWQTPIFILLLTTLMLSQQSIVIPLYELLENIGLLNSLFGLMLVHAAYALPFYIFILRGFFAAIPIELDQAASVDGASDRQTLQYIIGPLMIPGIAVAASINFISVWNEFFFAAIFLADSDKYPVTVGLVLVTTSKYFASFNMPAAAALIAQLPTVIFYVVAYRWITRGFVGGAVKG
jgi:raffinose/stachyose/melibiose transport system permease protein